ncbi:MAG: hypothetical protein KDC38_11075 [Planctomycetes bacterium]|nr:hypothetical protein [Planctomycetota bacterium]
MLTEAIRRPRILATVFSLFGILIPPQLTAQPYSETESFALADDRAAALGAMTPGSVEHDYFAVLLAQQRGELDRAQALLGEWAENHPADERYHRLVLRQALSRYSENPAATFEYLRRHVDIADRPWTEEAPPTERPTVLSPSETSDAAWLQHAERKQDLEGFTSSGLWRIADRQLDEIEERHLLDSIDRPDFPDLVSRILRDLERRRHATFGDLKAHRALTLAQLEECGRRRPALFADSAFVASWVARLQPSNDIDRVGSDSERDRELVERLAALGRRLPPSHRELLAHALYHRLRLDWRSEAVDLETFLEYLALPIVRETQPKTRREEAFRTGTTILYPVRQEWSGGLECVSGDWPLVRTLLLHLLADR